MRKLIYVDDEPQNLFTLKVSLELSYEIITFHNPLDAIEYQKNNVVEVLITDQRMPQLSGLELAAMIKKNSPNTVIIILTAYDDQKSMLRAINQGGIFFYFLKPWDINEMVKTLRYAYETYDLRSKNTRLISDLKKKNTELEAANEKIQQLNSSLQEENILLKTGISGPGKQHNIIGKSQAIKEVMHQLSMVAESDSSVILFGESGTGKELFALALHNLSRRKEKHMVKINCAAIPETLLESELFGHEKGAFTNADKLKYGKFELADQGTLFLDEIGELPMQLQPKLLRVLQEKEFERVGGTRPIKINIRLITATNRNLEDEIAKKNFRSDLYYRLNVFPVKIPPLRDRKEDIPLLVEHFIKKLNRSTGKDVKQISKKSLKLLQEYHWPGNVRELENIIERAHVLSKGNQLKLGKWIKEETTSKEKSDFLPFEEFEKKYILHALKHTGWRIRGTKGAANLLQLKPTTLESKMKKFNIKRPD